MEDKAKIIPILKRYFSYQAVCPSFGPEKIHYGIKPCFLVFKPCVLVLGLKQYTTESSLAS